MLFLAAESALLLDGCFLVTFLPLRDFDCWSLVRDLFLFFLFVEFHQRFYKSLTYQADAVFKFLIGRDISCQSCFSGQAEYSYFLPILIG